MTLLEATYMCRRGKTSEFDIASEHLKDAINVLVVDSRTGYCWNIECPNCKGGHTGWVLKDEPNTGKQTYDVKFCKLTIVSAKPHDAGVVE